MQCKRDFFLNINLKLFEIFHRWSTFRFEDIYESREKCVFESKLCSILCTLSVHSSHFDYDFLKGNNCINAYANDSLYFICRTYFPNSYAMSTIARQHKYFVHNAAKLWSDASEMEENEIDRKRNSISFCSWAHIDDKSPFAANSKYPKKCATEKSIFMFVW